MSPNLTTRYRARQPHRGEGRPRALPCADLPHRPRPVHRVARARSAALPAPGLPRCPDTVCRAAGTQSAALPAPGVGIAGGDGARVAGNRPAAGRRGRLWWTRDVAASQVLERVGRAR